MKGEERNNPVVNKAVRHYRIVGAIMILVLLVVFAKVLKTIFVEGDKWRAIGETLHRPEPVDLAPIRGNIYAADGRAVAITAPYYRLYFDFQAEPIKLLKPDSLNKLLDTLALSISRKLSTSSESIRPADLKKNWRQGMAKKSRYWPVINKDISYLQMKELYDMPPLAAVPRKGLGPIPRSIRPEEKAKRMMPFGSLGSRTIGSVYGSMDEGLSQGKNGIELHYDSLLRGEIGKGSRIYVGGRRILNTIDPPKRGCDVYTTLDMDMQSIVEVELRNKLEEVMGESGTAILMEVATGQIKAITNLQRTASGGYIEAKNYAVSDMSEPGSTFKTVSMMVALDAGVVHPNDIIETGNGLFSVGKRVVRDHNAHKGGYGSITAAQTIWYSSNVGVSKIILKGFAHDPDKYVEAVRRTGITDKLDLEIPGEAPAVVRKRADNPDRWYGTTLAWMSFGYETQIPPIHTLAFYNAIANGGRMMRPYFVTKVMDKGEVIRENKPTVLRDSICKRSTLLAIQDMLTNVVAKGTGAPVKSPTVNISGKTGTAQISQGKGGYHAGGTMHLVSFCGYFPTENPRYTCMVVVRGPRGVYPSGGGVSGAVVRQIAEKLLAIQEPEPFDTVSPLPNIKLLPWVSAGQREPIVSTLQALKVPIKDVSASGKSRWIRPTEENEKIGLRVMSQAQRGVMPNVIGLSAQDALYMLQLSGLKVRTNGWGHVVRQSINYGTKVSQGQTVVIDLSM